MKNLAVRLAVALVTFAVGVSLTALMFSRPTTTTRVLVNEVTETELLVIHSDCGPGHGSKGKRDETPEERAVRLAEEFVARNGYTDLPPDRDNLAYESIEWETDVDKMLKFRHDTLERNAYGIRYGGNMNGPGWMVAFRNKGRYGNVLDKMGCVVTLDANFENLRMEHKSFPLGNVHKKF